MCRQPVLLCASSTDQERRHQPKQRISAEEREHRRRRCRHRDLGSNLPEDRHYYHHHHHHPHHCQPHPQLAHPSLSHHIDHASVCSHQHQHHHQQHIVNQPWRSRRHHHHHHRPPLQPYTSLPLSFLSTEHFFFSTWALFSSTHRHRSISSLTLLLLTPFILLFLLPSCFIAPIDASGKCCRYLYTLFYGLALSYIF